MDSVVFDMMGVLFEGGHFISDVLYKQVADRMPLPDLQRRYIDLATGKIDRPRFWSGLFDDWQAEERALLERLAPKPDLDAIRDLKGRCCLGLLTEIPTDWGLALLRKARLSSFFDVLVISGREGITKPDPLIYRRLVSRLPGGGRRIYIDDKPENLPPAARLGFSTIWLKNPGRSFTIDFTPGRVAESLTETRRIIESELFAR